MKEESQCSLLFMVTFMNEIVYKYRHYDYPARNMNIMSRSFLASDHGGRTRINVLACAPPNMSRQALSSCG